MNSLTRQDKTRLDKTRHKKLVNQDFIKILSFFIVLWLLLSLVWIQNVFGQVSIEQILFHCAVPLTDSVDPHFIWSYSLTTAGGLLIAVWYSWLLCKKRRSRACSVLLVSVIVICCFYAEKNYDISGYIRNQFETTNIFDSVPLRNDIHVNFSGERKNLVVIHLESIENTFNRPSVFGEKVMPELEELALKNLSFGHFHQVRGTSWTMGGQTSAFFGLPLLLPVGGNNYGRFKDYLPGAKSLFEILEENGYALEFIAGLNLNFGGKKNMIKSHTKNAVIKDRSWLLEHRKDAQNNAGNGWGLRDRYIYETAKKDIALRAQGDAPWAVFLETMDTHGPDNHYFLDPGFTAKHHDFRDVLGACSSMAATFVEWLQEQPFYKDTVIVLLGDHFWMGDSIAGFSLGKRQEREVYNVFVNALPSVERRGTRQFCSVDWAPTILEAIGASLPNRKWGLGVSLFSDQNTLIEDLGEARLNAELGKTSKHYKTFFQVPSQDKTTGAVQAETNVFSHQNAPKLSFQDDNLYFRTGAETLLQCLVSNVSRSRASSCAPHPIFIKAQILSEQGDPLPQYEKILPLPRDIEPHDCEIVDYPMRSPDIQGNYKLQISFADEDGKVFSWSQRSEVALQVSELWLMKKHLARNLETTAKGFQEDEAYLLENGLRCVAFPNAMEVFYSNGSLFYRISKGKKRLKHIILRGNTADMKRGVVLDFDVESRKLADMSGQADSWAAVKLEDSPLEVLETGYIDDKGKQETLKFTLASVVSRTDRLHEENNFRKYLKKLANPRYLAFIAVKDEGSSGLQKEDRKLFRALGLEMLLEGKYRESYIATIHPSAACTEKVSKEALVWEESVNGLPVRLESSGWNSGNRASVSINGVEYAVNRRGMNFVVYDKTLDMVVDSVAFDTFNSSCAAVREKASKRPFSETGTLIAQWPQGPRVSYRQGKLIYQTPWEIASETQLLYSSDDKEAPKLKSFNAFETCIETSFEGACSAVSIPTFSRIIHIGYIDPQGKQYLKTVDLGAPRFENDFTSYLKKIDNSNYIVLISAFDEASSQLNKEHQKAFAALGLDMLLQGRFRWSYLAISDGTKKILEATEEKKLSHTTSLDGHKISLLSSGYKAGSSSSIKIDGIEYSLKRRGLNIVLYDKTAHAVVDSVVFDTYRSMKATRKQLPKVL